MDTNKKDGLYYYSPHRSFWGIWQWHFSESGVGFGTFIKDCATKEEARKEVYSMNGWNKEKKV